MAFPGTLTSRVDKALADSAPLSAFVGAGDLAVEKLREARELDANELKELKEQAQAKLHAGMESLQSDFRLSPELVIDIPVRLQAAMRDMLSASSTTYDELVIRGRAFVAGMRPQPSAEQFTDSMSENDATDNPAE